VLFVSDRFPDRKSSSAETGRLKHLPEKFEPITPFLKSRVIDVVTASDPSATKVFLSVCFLMQVNTGRTGAFLLSLLASHYIHCSHQSLFASIRHYRDNKCHPIANILEESGEFDATCKEIDAELASNYTKLGKWLVLPSWIVCRGAFDVKISNLSNVSWAYRKVDKNGHSIVIVPSLSIRISKESCPRRTPLLFWKRFQSMPLGFC